MQDKTLKFEEELRRLQEDGSSFSKKSEDEIQRLKAEIDNLKKMYEERLLTERKNHETAKENLTRQLKEENEQNLRKLREEMDELMKRLREEKDRKIKELESLLADTRDKSGNKMAELDRQLKDMELQYQEVSYDN